MLLNSQTLLKGFISRTNHFLHKYNVDHNYLFSQKHIIKYSEILENSNWGNWNENMLKNKPYGNAYHKYIIYNHPQNKYKICLFDWNGHSTPIHNHSKGGCFMKLLTGSLTEEKYAIKGNSLMKTHTRIIDTPKQISYIHDTMGFHKIISKKNTYSIHIYFPARHKTISI